MYAIGRLVRRARRHATAGLPRPLLSALSALDLEGPLCPRDLAQLEGVSKASMTPVIAALAAAGLIVRKPHPRDGRQFFVALTRRGRNALARERATKHEWLLARLGEISPEELAALEAAIPALQQLASP